ncbi:uncharacterized protein LOC112694116 isoform X2 [Sipha flava]|uniref:Uncharacterized protein LOC112694116 isoform X2 n=1 Tax=Sipha flava TaxID=143950 RepID=A0A8B8GSN8_9HEMI|nr:uncharacterized protein LOC112694116 isoform X2 [Sipha flava]
MVYFKKYHDYNTIYLRFSLYSIKCSPNDLLCVENKTTHDSPSVKFSGSFIYMLWSQYNYNENKINNSRINYANYKIRNQEDPKVDDYARKSKSKVSIKNLKKKVKRSLELVEEHAPEGTYRPQFNEDEALSHTSPDLSMKHSMPSIPTIPTTPSISQPVTMSLVESKITNTEGTNQMTTTTSNVELIETTTEDYSDMGEPNCDYDPIKFVLKCALNLITSIFGLSDTCCKPIF